jgi:anti-sigma regulatory factor (Ser/Thr protein kinase)
MRTGAAAGHRGYYHEAVCYDSDDHLLAVVLPFLLGGVAAGEPTIVALGERTAGLVRAGLPAASPVEFLTGGDMYARPAAAIRSYRTLLRDRDAAGAGQIRIIGEMPAEALGSTWDSWARYESAINHAYDEFPLWSMCAYDVRTTPGPVLDDVARTHPRTALPDGRHVPNDDYVDPVTFLGELRPVRPDPVRQATPSVELVDPSPAHARQVVREADRGEVPAEDVEHLVVAVSEVVTNAQRHGRPPVRLSLWSRRDRMVVSVSDGGEGPADPFAGLLPAKKDRAGGLGLWIAHQLCSHVALSRDGGAFTVWLTAGNAYAS